MRSAQPEKDQYPDVRRMVGLPHMVVGDFPANILRFLPSGARLISVSPKCRLDFRDALRTGLRLGVLRNVLFRLFVGGRFREERSREEQNQAVSKSHLSTRSRLGSRDEVTLHKVQLGLAIPRMIASLRTNDLPVPAHF